jgi:hypothetical protein
MSGRRACAKTLVAMNNDTEEENAIAQVLHNRTLLLADFLTVIIALREWPAMFSSS